MLCSAIVNLGTKHAGQGSNWFFKRVLPERNFGPEFPDIQIVNKELGRFFSKQRSYLRRTPTVTRQRLQVIMLSSLRQLRKTRFIPSTRSCHQLLTTREINPAPISKFLVQKVEKKTENGMLHVTWNNDSVNRYPFMFLRDNCRCSECFHESTLQRSFDTVACLDLNILPEKLEVTRDGTMLVITWPDSHVSVFDSEWLHSQRLPDRDNSSNERTVLNREGVAFWNADKLQDKIPRCNFQEIMEDDLALYGWLNNLHSLGIALVTNTPLQVGQVDKLSERVGHSKATHYGHKFEVKFKYDPNNLAYTSHDLQLHVDLPCYDYVPGVQMLHCIEQAPGIGGANQYVDGFHVAQELKDKDPEKFDLLSKARFQFVDVGKDKFGDFSMKFSRKMIELDENEQLVRFSINNHVRDSAMLVSPEDAVQLYEAYKTVGKMLRDPANKIEHKMKPGEIITFNNSRVLHGRSAFKVTGQGSRFLIGIYLDWDIIYSRMRVLAKTFNIPFHC